MFDKPQQRAHIVSVQQQGRKERERKVSKPKHGGSPKPTAALNGASANNKLQRARRRYLRGPFYLVLKARGGAALSLQSNGPKPTDTARSTGDYLAAPPPLSAPSSPSFLWAVVAAPLPASSSNALKGSRRHIPGIRLPAPRSGRVGGPWSADRTLGLLRPS